ncbi:hypothetical protein VE02_03173 [Pseudogymnoascus sp. 03VT05]|nr:hypothetical protein VE02_03173 [Pseudogymnoascus sp. 03VT05]
MSDDESQESLDYLQSNFEPSTLTVPRLRSILVSHDIPYPSGAKKPQLIEIFTDKVLPQSRKIISARSRARRTSKGITNADRSDAGSLEEEQPILPPPSASRTKSARKPSARIREDTIDSEEPRARTRSRSPVKQTPRVTSAKHPRAATEDSSEPDTIRRTVRKTRKSEAPIVKSEDLDEDFPRKGAAFSYDNPFQSGSSPISSSRSPSGERRRKTLHETPAKRKSSATPRRRTADIPQSRADDGITPPSSATFELAHVPMDHSIEFDDNAVETSEEFTPEEQLQLDTERAAGRASTPIARRPKKKSPGSGFNAKGPLWVVFLTMLGGYAAWYRQEKLAVGYCGVGRPAAPIVSSKLEHLPDWALALAEPECEVCPQHAFCYERLETACEPDFVLRPHPLALGGVVPLPPTCEPDGEKVRRIKVVADRAVEELRERRAKFECGAKEEGGEVVKTVEIGEQELKKRVSDKRRRGMGQAEFEELWAGAIGEIMGREEVEVVKDEPTTPGYPRLSSSSLAALPLSCALRRSLRLAVARHRLQIAILALITTILLYARAKYSSYLAISAKIPELISLTLDRLAEQAARHAMDPVACPEAYIPISQLRDDVLRDEHSLTKRDAIWQKVRNVVEMNANVRSAQRQDRNGEIARVWEWIGAVAGQVAERERRKSGRVSWGEFGEASSPVSGTDGGPEVVQQRWKEGRPIY